MADSEVKRDTKDGGETSVPLNCKTWVLRVSIHCEACKRKVEKILKKIQGISTTEVDLRQQMVTVTGNIEAETLIKRFKKEGKNAVLWPQKPQEPVKAKNKERKSDPNAAKETQKERQTVETEASEKDQSAKVNSEASGKEGSKEKATIESEPATDRAGDEDKEVKQEGKEKATASAEKQPFAGEGEGGAEKSGGDGSAGKKKKKQGQNGKKANGEGGHSGEAPASTGSGPEEPKSQGQPPNPNAGHRSRPRQQPGQHPVPPRSTDVPAGPGPQHEAQGQGPILGSPNHAAPGYHDHWYPPPHHAPPAHVFSNHAAPRPYEISYHAAYPAGAVSYQTANPSTSYATSHHAPDPPPYYEPPLYSRPYMHPGTGPEELPPYYSNTNHQQQSDSFEYFSDENPNGCSIM